MARVASFHAEGSGVHHVCSRCTEGNNIEPRNKRQGTGGKPLCQSCRERIANGTC